jgi:thymidylate synthase
MYISAETLDDALLKLYPALLARSNDSVTASRGETAEVIGALIEIGNSSHTASHLAERPKNNPLTIQPDFLQKI